MLGRRLPHQGASTRLERKTRRGRQTNAKQAIATPMHRRKAAIAIATGMGGYTASALVTAAPPLSRAASRAPSTVPTGSAQILLARGMRGKERRCVLRTFHRQKGLLGCRLRRVRERLCIKHGANGFCSAEGCDTAASARGLCQKHGARGFCSFGNCTSPGPLAPNRQQEEGAASMAAAARRCAK